MELPITVTEIWRAIPGWPSYEVSSQGRVRSIDRTDRLGRHYQGKVRKLFPSTNGRYLRVQLKAGNTIWRNYEVHQLVAAGFLGERPQHLVTSHENGKGHDNRADNLLYETQQDNLARMSGHGTKPLGENHWVNRLGASRGGNGRFREVSDGI